MRGWQVAVLARAPVAGQAKTRLIPRLGAERAAALQAHLMELALQRACATGARVVLWLAGSRDPRSVELARRYDAELLGQPEGDLGDRMLAAVRHACAANMDSIVIGTDCPTQTTDDLLQARAMVASAGVVLQPAFDGGYVLIGMREPHPELFSGIAWGGASVLDLTRRRCAAHGLGITELRTLRDLDRPEDLDAAFDAGVLERAPWS